MSATNIEIFNALVSLDKGQNLEGLPEVQAMRKILAQDKPELPLFSCLTAAAGFNDYGQYVHPDARKGSYMGGYVEWVISKGESAAPWARYKKQKDARFAKFKASGLWGRNLLKVDSVDLRTALLYVLGPHNKVTTALSILLLHRLSYVVGASFRLPPDYSIAESSRVRQFIKRNPEIGDIKDFLSKINVSRAKKSLPQLEDSDFDAWIWQYMARDGGSFQRRPSR